MRFLAGGCSRVHFVCCNTKRSLRWHRLWCCKFRFHHHPFSSSEPSSPAHAARQRIRFCQSAFRQLVWFSNLFSGPRSHSLLPLVRPSPSLELIYSSQNNHITLSFKLAISAAVRFWITNKTTNLYQEINDRWLSINTEHWHYFV